MSIQTCPYKHVHSAQVNRIHDGRMPGFWATACTLDPARNYERRRGGVVKGFIFTELLAMAENSLSTEIVEEVLLACDLPSGGAYTSVGTYPKAELTALILAFSERLGTSPAAFTHDLGVHLFKAFRGSHSGFFTNIDGTYDLLRRIEDEIHVEVRKLYPDAELPTFACSEPILGDLILEYRSTRGLAHLASGLIAASIEHFKESITVQQEDISDNHNTHVIFTLHRS
ncbi:MAG TPA: hypothetical protein ENK31_09120 [Nannocystis exedens]|nr:hypothetical protein [Nannocystis exedens]